MFLVPAYAGPGWQITVQTDKSNYHIGDKVYINGTLTYNAYPVQNRLVIITVKTPSGTLFYPPLPSTGEYGDYTANWTLGGANAMLGIWAVTASYGSPETDYFVYTNTTGFQVVDIRITASGDVEPADAPIARTGDIYTVTGNI